jgi:ABC-type metal ion transport system substrate-binding protein
MKKPVFIVLALCLLLAFSPALASAPQTIRIGVLDSDYAEVLELVRDDLGALGYELSIVEFAVSALLNPSLSAQEFEAHYVQGIAFVEEYNAYAGQAVHRLYCGARAGHWRRLCKGA